MRFETTPPDDSLDRRLAEVTQKMLDAVRDENVDVAFGSLFSAIDSLAQQCPPPVAKLTARFLFQLADDIWKRAERSIQ